MTWPPRRGRPLGGLPALAVRQQLPDIEAMLAMLRSELKPARSREITAKLMAASLPI
jgi:hypothetical protein